MASGIERDMQAAPGIVAATAEQQLIDNRLRRLGLSPKQIEFNRLYAYFRTQQYEDCQIDWDGTKHADPLARAAITSSEVLPPGHNDPSGNLGQVEIPLRYRRPSVPCHLCKLIVWRFTSLLFSERANPTWKVVGDDSTEAWVQTVSEHYGLWAAMITARNLGGAMGTAAFGFKAIDGRLQFETFDRRWCFPEFDPRRPDELTKLEIRYMYPKEERDPISGAWVEKLYWYRRIIDTEDDVLWAEMPVGDGSAEPPWKDPNTYTSVHHNFGFVPIEWVQNIEVTDDMDGDPDCLGCYDHFDRIGELDSQAHRGAVKNTDPTAVITTDGTFPGTVKLGSDEAIKLDASGNAKYLELAGSGVRAASDLADRLQDKTLQIAQCVLPEQMESGGKPTATEIMRRTSGMHSKAALLRRQYGKALVRMMTKLVRAARALAQPQQGEGGMVRREIEIPPKEVDGELVKQAPGTVLNAQITLVWPPFDEPTPQDIQANTNAASVARSSRIITLETAVRHVARDFHIEDVNAEVEKLGEEGPADYAARSLLELNEGR